MEEDKLKWRVTNNGDVIGISFALEKFFINEHEVYGKIQSQLKKIFKKVEKTKEGKYKVYKSSIYIGEDSVIVDLKKSIV